MGIKSNNPSESYFNFFGASGKGANPPEPSAFASGGTITSPYPDSGSTYVSHVFTSPGSFVVKGSPGTV